MKPLLLILSGTTLALALAADPSFQGKFLSGVVATAWAQQDRGRDKERDKERDDDKERGGDKDRDHDKGKDEDHDKGNDKDEDRGGSDGDQEGAPGADDGKDRDSDRGGDEGKDRDSDKDSGKGQGKGEDKGPDEDRGHGNDDKDNGGSDAGEPPSSEPPSSEPPSSEPPGGEPPGSEPPSAGPIEGEPSGSNDVANREPEPAERGKKENEGDSENAGRLTGRFDLDETEMFDNDGFLARRGEIIALSTSSTLDRRAAALGLKVAKREALPSLNTTVYRILVPAGSPIDGILARLRADEPDGVFDRNHLYDSSASNARSGAVLSAPMRSLVSSAAGVSMGLIDTGVDVLNPATRGGLSELRYFVDESKELPETHGTAIVSLLVSQNGLLPGAQLYIACVFYEDRRGGLLSEAGDLVRALEWLMERRVPVINMSLSGPPNEVLRAAISRAVAAGHLIVAAVGNSGPASPPLYPAAYDGVIAVTAVDNKGHVYRRANRGAYVEFAALGVDVVAAAPDGLAAYSGTSFASPYVAALAAMQYRSLDPQQAIVVKDSLRTNALDLGKPGRDEIYGFGLARPPAISTAAR